MRSFQQKEEKEEREKKRKTGSKVCKVKKKGMWGRIDETKFRRC